VSGHRKWSEIKQKRTVHVEAHVAVDVDHLLECLPPLLAAGGAGDPAVIYGHEQESVFATFQVSTRTAGEAVEAAVELLASSIEQLYGFRPEKVTVEISVRPAPAAALVR
jgi:hypothetical protein